MATSYRFLFHLITEPCNEILNARRRASPRHRPPQLLSTGWLHVLLAHHDSITPRTPGSVLAILLPPEIFSILSLVFIFLNDSTNPDPFLYLFLHHPTNALHLLHKIASSTPDTTFQFSLGSKLLEGLELFRIAVNLFFYLLCCKAVLMTTTLDTFDALANASAETTKIGTIPGTPGPASHVRGIVCPERLPTRLTNPHLLVTRARIASNGGMMVFVR